MQELATWLFTRNCSIASTRIACSLPARRYHESMTEVTILLALLDVLSLEKYENYITNAGF